MIDTKEQYERIVNEAGNGILGVLELRVQDLTETIEALRDIARWAYHPDSCHTQMTGDRPCNCGYQELRNALPDWLIDG